MFTLEATDEYLISFYTFVTVVYNVLINHVERNFLTISRLTCKQRTKSNENNDNSRRS